VANQAEKTSSPVKGDCVYIGYYGKDTTTVIQLEPDGSN